MPALSETLTDSGTDSAVHMLLDDASTSNDRLVAATLLGLIPTTRYRVIAQPGSTTSAVGEASAVISSVAGAVHAEIILSTDTVAAPRAGIGIAAAPADLLRSWQVKACVPPQARSDFTTPLCNPVPKN